MKYLLVFIFLSFIVISAYSQDLLNERIRKLSSKKMGVYLTDGIFHNGQVAQNSAIKSIRQSYDHKTNNERVVFDFSTESVPRVYGNISNNKRKIYIDIFNSQLNKNIKAIGDSKYLDHIYFYPIDNIVSVEMILKKNTGADIFYLSNPGRLVIDLKQ